MLDAPAPHQQPAKKPDPLEIISKCIVKARSANFGEEIELGVTLFRSGTAVVRIERHDVTVTAQLTEESLQQLATGMLTVIGNARHVRGDANHAIDADCDVDPLTDNCRVCGVHHSDACQSCGARAFHVDGCPGGV